jgi:hypothetical protein
MLFRDMTAQVVANLGLEDTAGFDEVTYVKGLVNRGVVDVLSRTRCTVRCVDMRVLAGVSEYTVGNQILSLVDIEDGLGKVNRDSSYQPSFTMIRSDILRLQPTPSEDGEVQVWAVKRPQPMSADLDDPQMEQFGAIPDEFQDAILLRALWTAGDYADDSTSNQGERFRILYEGQDGKGGRLGQIRQLVNKRGTARAPRRRVRGLAGVNSSDHWAG